MEENKSNNVLTEQAHKSRLKIIVLAHFLVAGTFFAVTFFWGNFA